MVWIIVIVILSAFDQLIKYLIRSRLALAEQVTVIDSFFYLTHRENTGAAWSFLAEPAWGIYVLSGVSLILVVFLIILLLRVQSLPLNICLTLIISGSIGNLIDRLRLGAVTDYLDFHFGSYIFPTFNLADTLIVLGTILLCVFIWRDPGIVDLIFLTKQT